MRKSKWQIFGSLFSSCVILIMLAFSVKLFMQNGAGSSLKVFAKGSSGAMITASVEGYDENLSNINKKEFSTKLNGKRVRNWDIGDMAFGADENGNPKTTPARYYEELYFANGSVNMSEENEQVCTDVLDRNGAVGIFGLLEQKDFPIYCVSGFALTALGYSFDELRGISDGFFIELVHEEDRERFIEEFYEKGKKRRYRLRKKNGEIITATTYSADTELSDGVKAKMLSIRVG